MEKDVDPARQSIRLHRERPWTGEYRGDTYSLFKEAKLIQDLASS